MNCHHCGTPMREVHRWETDRGTYRGWLCEKPTRWEKRPDEWFRCGVSAGE